MIEHPSIADLEFERWRYIKTGGDAFVERYLVKREEENPTTFSARASITPDPSTASSAVDDVINSLVARLDVNRSGGAEEYQIVISGKLGGVDRQGTDLQTYMVRETVPELCYMKKFCWVIQNFTSDFETFKTPFIKPYKAEDIVNWEYEGKVLKALGLREFASVVNEDTGFSEESVEIFRVFRLIDGRVETHIENVDGIEIDIETLQPGSSTEVLSIDEIPAIIFEIPTSLLQKIDRLQIAVLNLESSDIEWLRTANITLYTEQNNGFQANLVQKSLDPTAEADVQKIVLGNTNGRTYGLNMDRPGFIAPPSDPIRVSMEKQKELALKAKDILKSTLSDMKQASAESISLLGQGMEAGLFTIGTALLLGEIKYARIFHKYLNRGDQEATITYPKKYELRTETDRLEKAKALKKVQQTMGSNTAKKFMEIQILQVLLEGKIPHDAYQEAVKEIMDQDFNVFDPDVITTLSDSGVISRSLAAKTLGAPEEDAQRALDEHIQRIVAVQISQTDGQAAVPSGTNTEPNPVEAERLRKEAENDIRNIGGS